MQIDLNWCGKRILLAVNFCCSLLLWLLVTQLSRFLGFGFRTEKTMTPQFDFWRNPIGGSQSIYQSQQIPGKAASLANIFLHSADQTDRGSRRVEEFLEIGLDSWKTSILIGMFCGPAKYSVFSKSPKSNPIFLCIWSCSCPRMARSTVVAPNTKDKLYARRNSATLEVVKLVFCAVSPFKNCRNRRLSVHICKYLILCAVVNRWLRVESGFIKFYTPSDIEEWSLFSFLPRACYLPDTRLEWSLAAVVHVDVEYDDIMIVEDQNTMSTWTWLVPQVRRWQQRTIGYRRQTCVVNNCFMNCKAGD